MPGYCIHAAHGKEILALLTNAPDYTDIKTFDDNFRKEFLAGILLPDAAKKATCSDAHALHVKSHYPENPDSYFCLPELMLFLREHPLSLEHPLWIGYAAHLYLDRMYIQYLQGMVTVQTASQSETAKIVTQEKVYTSDAFWKEIYQDYTKLNPYLILKHEITASDFAAADQLDPESDVRYISWYSNLMEDFHALLEQAKAEKKDTAEKTTFLSKDQVDILIKRAAEGFYETYLKPLRDRRKRDYTDLEQTASARKRKGKASAVIPPKWAAESVKLKYYEAYWKALAEDGHITPFQRDFFDSVKAEILDTTNSANEHKKKYLNQTLALSVLPITASILSGIAAVMTDASQSDNTAEMIFKILSAFAAVVNMGITILTQHIKNTAHKESWLRQRRYYANIMNETECFCNFIGKYAGKGTPEAVALYMEEIKNLRMQDYADFFTNMGYGSHSSNSESI